MTNFIMEEHDKILVDANIFIALYYSLDPHHQKVLSLIKRLQPFKIFYVTNNYIINEAITLILIRSKSLSLASNFAGKVYKQTAKWFAMYQADEFHQKETCLLFESQKKYRGEFLSFTDCTLIAQAKRQKIKTIFTFDETFRQFESEGIKILS